MTAVAVAAVARYDEDDGSMNMMKKMMLVAVASYPTKCVQAGRSWRDSGRVDMIVG